MNRIYCGLLFMALFAPLLAQEKPAEPATPVAKPAAATKSATAAKPVAAPAAKAAADLGTGFFFEGYGLFTLAVAAQTSTGSTRALPDGAVVVGATSYKSPNTMGFGGGGAFGYFMVPNLAVMLSFDYRYLKSRKWTTSSSGVSSDQQNKYATSWIGLGLRPRLAVGPGAVYAGAGVAFLLPHEDIVTATASGTNSTSTTTTEFNFTIGAYGEMGYQLELTEGIYMGVGTRLFIAGPSNKGGISETGTVQVANVETVTNSSGETAFASKNITDISFNLTLGLRL